MGSAPLLGTTPGRRRLALLTLGLLLVALALGASRASAATLLGTVSSQAPGQALLPAAGASVTVLDPQSGTTVGLATTGLDGAYSLAIPSGTYDVRFDPPPGGDFVSTTVGGIAVDTARRLDVVLVPAGLTRVSGVIRDQAGPVAGADVQLFPIVGSSEAYASSGADGSYSFVVEPGSYALHVERYGQGAYQPSFWSFDTEAFDVAGSRVIDATLPAISTLTVRVLDDAGQPIAGAQVDLPGYQLPTSFGGAPATLNSGWWFYDFGLRGVTDAGGEARFAVFDRSAPVRGAGLVTPPADSAYGPTSVSVSQVQGDTTVVVHPDRAIHVSGVVRDAAGPVQGADVQLIPISGPSTGSTQTAADGSYAFPVATGSYALHVERYGQGPNQPSFWSFDTEAFDVTADRAVDATLPAVSTLTVRVLDDADQPIAGAQVDLPGYRLSTSFGGVPATLNSGWWFFEFGLRGVTDEQGEARFTIFDGSTPVNDRGLVTPPADSGYGPTSVSVSQVQGDTTVVVHPDGAIHVSGVVRDAAGAISGADVQLIPITGPSTGGTQTGADGAYSFPVAPGSYGLHIERYGQGPNQPSFWSLDTVGFDVASDRVVDVSLPPVSTLTVRVVGADGVPVPDAQVDVPGYQLATSFGGVPATLNSGWWFFEFGLRGVTDASGEVRFTIFDGSAPVRGDGLVTPPAASGYGPAHFAVPGIQGDSTVVVHFAPSTPPDTTAPTIACDAPPAGWHPDEVSVACTASDAGSGLADPADASFSLSTSVGDGNEDASAQTGTRQVCDRAGNCATAGPIGPIAVDRKAPAIAFSQQPDGANGWWIASPGTTHATASDLTITSLDCLLDGLPQALVPTASPGALALDVGAAGEGRHSVSCTATDGVGHTTTGGDAVRIDLTAPNAPRLSADRAPDYAGRGGWYRDAVTVSVLDDGDPPLADGTAGSGVDPASIPAPANLATSGNHSVSGSVADLAGNASLTTTAVFRVDADPPQTTLTCPTGSVSAGVKASARWKDRDGESGLATAATGSIALDTSVPGTYAVQHTGTDDVGHSASSSCSYTVV